MLKDSSTLKKLIDVTTAEMRHYERFKFIFWGSKVMKREKIEKECPENQERELKSQKNKLENVEIKAIGNDKKRVEREKKVRKKQG